MPTGDVMDVVIIVVDDIKNSEKEKYSEISAIQKKELDARLDSYKKSREYI